jgi:hypothetical protein
MKSILRKKKFWTLTVVVTHDEAVTGSNNLFCYFRYFWKACNKSQGYFCFKCKKKNPKSTHPNATLPYNDNILYLLYLELSEEAVVKAGEADILDSSYIPGAL